ncbi:MAG: bifunctional diaminohydroxyphosphoribosylaminopyrimidine deaminase/5-amino-6-(5-phosphoribosylamino)uracil reductase RibD [Dehalococcoidia bacterium]|nr:bifunctional diaminohydroxyphosphoribosylaminopyrimidine deaminase/5-amino-6-(5-phosphoribosylamino)uracil reductase RibD [Dehalococcoidia bacterium]
MDYMKRALSLAELALGHASPNPSVGAVIVNDGDVVGEGYTQPPGSAHAEIMALQQAGESARGSTMYVTLEPCCHYGRTPPCTGSIIAAGVEEVYMAMLDPDSRVLGMGKEELEKAGIKVYLGDYEKEARELNEAYIKHVATELPFVTAKFAMSLDGKIATRTGDSRWISGEESRRRAHWMRYATDAIVVGINTILVDDPRLTQRVGKDGGQLEKQPLRVIVDSKGRIPLTAQVFRVPGETLIAVASPLDEEKKSAFAERGIEVVELPPEDGLVNLDELLKELGKRDIINLLVEGGGSLLGSFFDGGLVDKVMVFIAPVLIGGGEAVSPICGEGASKISEAAHLSRVKVQRLGDDVLVEGYVG